MVSSGFQVKGSVGDESGSLPSFWETRVAPFFEKHFFALCVSLIGIACARIVATYHALSLTTDEPDDYAAGLEYLVRHTYSYNVAHPPLSRLMQALGPYLTGARLPDLPVTAWHPLDLLALTGNVDRTVWLMRLGNLPFYILACLVVCGWAWHAFGKPVAVLATGLFSLLPATLAEGGLAITDLALGATVGAAFFAAVLWAEKPTWARALGMGVFTAMACLSKFTAVGFIPGCLGLALVFYLSVRWPGWRGLLIQAKQRVPTFLLAAVTAGLVIWAVYWFSIGKYYSHRLGIVYFLPAPGFLTGVGTVFTHNSNGHGSFLLGHFSWHGWWFYFPVALAVKTPIAFLVFTLVGFFVCARERMRPFYLLPVAFIIGIFVLALRSHIDIGIRHIDPLWIGFSILAALGFRQVLLWARTGVACALTGGALIAWMAISVGVHHPDYLGYFNAFAGSRPERILVDSNYDWGQDMKLLGKRLREMGVENVALAVTEDAGNRRPTNYANMQAWYGLPHAEQVNVCVPSPGWNVVSTSVEKSLSRWPSSRYYRGPGAPTAWYEMVEPTERLGPLMLFNIPQGSTLRSQGCDPSSTN